MRSPLPALLAGALDLLAPPRCVACDELLPPGPARFCPVCASLLEPLDGPSWDDPVWDGASEGAPLLGDALADGAPSGASPPTAAYRFGGPMADAIARFKYAGRSELAEPLGALLADAAAAFAGEVDVVTPVPLHPRKLRARGYNQAGLLARHVARWLAVPLDARVVRRVRETSPQASLERAARATNVRGAFRASPLALRVLLIDDVQTTGATLAECAATLTAAGAARVHPFALARAM